MPSATPARRDWARDLYDAAAVGFEDFWDAERGLYVDHILDGERRPAASQVAQACAIVSGLAPRERWSPLVDAMTDPIASSCAPGSAARPAATTRSSSRSRCGASSASTGTPSARWSSPSLSSATPCTTPSRRPGAPSCSIDLVRRWEEFLVDGYDTFGECWGWGTPVHGWSSTPTRDLVVYVLGITPAEPGYRPRPRGAAAWAAARASRRRPDAARPGRGASGWLRGGDRQPGPVVVVREDGTEIELAAGQRSGHYPLTNRRQHISMG